MFKKIFKALGLIFALVVVIVLVRTLLFRSSQIQVKPVKIAVDAQAVAQRLARSVTFKTISYPDHAKIDYQSFLAFHQYLQTAYPLAHKHLQREVVGKYSLLYTWKGSDRTLKPMMVMGHQDVVPVSPGTRKDWKYPPYAGRIAEQAIWGRGTLDDKVAILGSLEAVEALLARKFQPKRTLYLAFGHDEEIGGQGAQQIAALLKSRGVTLEYVLDEGMALTHGLIPGIKQPVALIGLAEKGYLTLKLSIKGKGGHSSMPPKHTAIGLLSRAITRLENHPMPATLDGPTGLMFQHLGPEMGFAVKLIVANLWLFKPLFLRILAGKNSTNASIRTTTAVTVFHSGVKDNVLPINASFLVNFRILPGDTRAKVQAYVKKVIADDRIQVSVYKPKDGAEPSPVSPTTSAGFKAIQRTIREVFPSALVAPNLVLGVTDARHLSIVCKNIYRFLPISVNSKDLKRIHGTNERITVSNYADVVRFYIRLLENSQR